MRLMGGKGSRNTPRKSAAEVWSDVENSQFHGVSLSSMRTGWDGAKELFDPRRADGVLRKLVPMADARLALAMMLLGGFVIFIFMLATAAESIYMGNLAAQTVSEISGIPQAGLDMSVILPIGLYQFVFYVIFATIANFAQEGIAYGIARATGGKGSFGQQAYLSSIVWMTLSYSLFVTLLAPFFCLAYLGILSVILVSFLYLMVYMGGRAYSIAHGLHPVHGAVISLILTIPKIILLLIATDWFTALMGLPKMIGG